MWCVLQMFGINISNTFVIVCVCLLTGSNPSELESMRDALEEAQRWNASLQARLGQIQNRGGGVGQANDSGMFINIVPCIYFNVNFFTSTFYS